MPLSKMPEGKDLRFIAPALAVWLAVSLLLLLVASLTLCGIKFSSQTAAYINSALSFLSAAAAGIYARRRSRCPTMFAGAVTAVVLVILLLFIGFIIDGQKIDSDGVLSVGLFTAAGSLSGSAIVKGRGRSKSKFTKKLH